MATRTTSANNHLEEAMALLIRNQAAFLESKAATDRELLELYREMAAQKQRSEKLERKTDERFASVDARLSRIETILLKLPDAIRQKIGFKAQK